MNYHTLGLTPENFDRTSVPQLDPKKVEILWSDGWYDGPLSGVMNYDGEKYYFDLYCPEDEGFGYQYVTIKLTDIEFQTVKTEHERWLNAMATYREQFGNDYGSPESRAFFDKLGFNHFNDLSDFYKKERITGWFSE